MKFRKLTIWLLFVTIVSSLTFNGCTKEESFVQESNEDLSAISAKAKKADIVISPSGDLSGVTDANTIEDALNNLPSGGTLLLEKGTFYINRPVVVAGFEGTLRGISKKKTEIIAVGSIGTPFQTTAMNSPFFGVGQRSSFFFFQDPQASLTVSHMALAVPDNFVAELNFLNNPLLGSFITVYLGGGDANTNFNSLKLKGAPNPNLPSFFDNQPIYGIEVFGNDVDLVVPPFSVSSNGEHIIKRSDISKVAIWAVSIQALKNAKVKITKSRFSDIRSIISRFMDGTDIIISKNQITANTLGAVVVTQEGFDIPGATNVVKIRDNDIATNGFAAVEIGQVPDPGAASFQTLIKENKLTNTGDGIFGSRFAIVIGEGNDNARVKENSICGTTDYGILQAADLGKFEENDFSQFNANLFDIQLLGDNNQVESEEPISVDDQGTGNNVVIDDDDDDDDD